MRKEVAAHRDARFENRLSSKWVSRCASPERSAAMTPARKLLLLVLVLSLLCGSAGIAPAAELVGRIWSVLPDEQRFTVTDRNGNDWIFSLDPKALIAVNNVSAIVTGLRPGDQVTVTYRQQGEALIAYDVNALRE
jgi:hypothetical protein